MKNKIFIFFIIFLTPATFAFAGGEYIVYKQIGNITISSIFGYRNESLKQNEILARACNQFLESREAAHPNIYISIAFGSFDKCDVSFEPFVESGVSPKYQKQN